MAGEDDGTGQGQPPEDYREYRRMMDAAGREGLLRMIEHLTGDLRANPRDTVALLARGLAYSELGGPSPRGGGQRQGHRPGPR